MSLTPERTAELQELCRQYRIDVLTAIHGAQSGHPGGCRSREMKFAAANWWFALRPAFFQIFSVFVMRVLIMGLSSCYDGENRRTGGSAARKAAAAAGDA